MTLPAETKVKTTVERFGQVVETHLGEVIWPSVYEVDSLDKELRVLWDADALSLVAWTDGTTSWEHDSDLEENTNA